MRKHDFQIALDQLVEDALDGGLCPLETSMALDAASEKITDQIVIMPGPNFAVGKSN